MKNHEETMKKQGKTQTNLKYHEKTKKTMKTNGIQWKPMETNRKSRLTPQKPPITTQKPWKTIKTTENHLKTMQNHQKPPTSMDHGKPQKTP